MPNDLQLPYEPDGLTKDLDGSATTMWFETDKECPRSRIHALSGSTSRIYCYTCKVWWWREGFKT